MRRFGLLFLTALASALIVHHGVLQQELSGADRGRAIGFYPDIGAAGPGAEPEMDLSAAIYRIEQLIAGTSHPTYMLMGLLWLALAGAALGAAARRLARRCEPGDRQVPLDIGMTTAALFPATALFADAVVSLPGHAALIGCLVFGLIVYAACRRTTPITMGLLPLLASLAFSETGGLAFLAAPVLVLFARPDAWEQVTRHKKLAWGFGFLLAARLSEIVWCPPLEAARDVSDPSLGFFATLLRSVTALVVPVPSEGGLGERAIWAHRISFGGVIIALGIWGHLCARSGQKRVALGALATTAWTLLIAARGPAISETYGDIRVLAFAAIGLALFLALAIDAAAHRGSRELVALAFAVFLIYSHVNAAAELRRLREAEVFPAEYQAVLENLKEVPEAFDDALLLGLDPKFPRAQWAKSLPAEMKNPWSDREISLRARAEDRYGTLDAGLFRENGRTLVCEWAPANFFRIRTRPEGWKISPLVASAAGPIADQPLRLVAPADNAELTPRLPESIEEDMTFVFETRPDFVLDDSTLLVFYAVYEGGRNPKGRSQITARPLVPKVLQKSVGEDGWTRWTWRPSIRPEEGHDGVRFEDRDLGIVGKDFYWTVGVAPLQPQKVAPAPEGSPPGHQNHAHDGSIASRIFPFAVAQTRRIHFVESPDN